MLVIPAHLRFRFWLFVRRTRSEWAEPPQQHKREEAKAAGRLKTDPSKACLN